MPATEEDFEKYKFKGRLEIILCGRSRQEARVAIEGPWREEGSEQICAFSRMFRKDDDLTSSVVAPPDGVPFLLRLLSLSSPAPLPLRGVAPDVDGGGAGGASGNAGSAGS